MIDEKKIEEAAQGAADLYEQDLPIMSYNEDTEVDGQHHFCQEFGAELFKDGAKWAIQEFLKDLWHPAEEEPDKSKSDIITLGFDNDAYLQFKESILWNKESWRHSISRCQIIKWAYLSDILPKEGGEQRKNLKLEKGFLLLLKLLSRIVVMVASLVMMAHVITRL